MSRAVGILCKKDTILFAIADDGTLVNDPAHERLQSPGLLGNSDALHGTLDDIRRVLREVRPDAARILMPEQTYEASYAQLAPRVVLETLIRIAGAESAIPVEMLHRNSARARTGMPRQGRFDENVVAVISAPVGRYWNSGRKLAAVAALAEDV